MSSSTDHDHILRATRHWLETAVIGLNLCPFAGVPWRQGRVRLRVSDARREQDLAEELVGELLRLDVADLSECETSLLIHPWTLGDFGEYNDFLDVADGLLQQLGLDGTMQIASFHPDYCFGDTTPEDPANCSNRSPYPMLHLLRESSVEAATARLSEPEAIYERNIQTLRDLGLSGWTALMKQG